MEEGVFRFVVRSSKAGKTKSEASVLSCDVELSCGSESIGAALKSAVSALFLARFRLAAMDKLESSFE